MSWADGTLLSQGRDESDLYLSAFVFICHSLKVFELFLERNSVFLTLFSMREGEGKKALRTSFSIVIFTNIGISPQNFLNFSLNPFSTLV